MHKLLVKAILSSPLGLSWSTQGLGMLRTYLSPELRLHIWDAWLRVENVSPIHDHPWHLDSLIVAGRLAQQRYVIDDECSTAGVRPDAYEKLNFAAIKCGEGAFTVSEVKKINVISQPLEIYSEGQSYQQRKDEVHESLPETGTVTLVTRTFTGDRDHARVFWRGDGGWVDAAPRPATPEEIIAVTQRALKLWF
jgi:hypothetical protein